MSTPPALRATYTSPTNAPFTHTASLPPHPQPTATAAKTAYLAALRQAAAQMQEVINRELTARMEEDHKRAGEGKDGKGGGRDEKREEENYGEEVVEEEEA